MIRSRNGKYQVVVYAGRVNLRDTYLRETHAGFEDAKRAENRLKRQVEEGSHSRNAAATVEELFTRWLAQVGPDLSPSTLRTYKGFVDGRIVPELGHLRVRKLAASELDRFYTGLRAIPLTASTVRHYHAVISSACAQAVKWGWIGANPANKATPPKLTQKQKIPPDAEAMRALLAQLEVDDPDLGLFLRLAAITGARRGELCALRWNDIDLDGAPSLTIARALVCANGTTIEKDTKTHGIRRLALDPLTADQLRAHHARESGRKAAVGHVAPDDHVFARVSRRRDGKTEGPWHPDAVTHAYRKAATAAGITAGLHDWRHWMVTQALAGGISVRQVADRAGHSQTSMTLNRYAHAIPAGDEAAAVVLARALDG